MKEALWLFSVLALIAAGLILFLAGLIARRWWLAFSEKKQAIHLRLLRSELLQALARGDSRLVIEHWSGRDRKAAFFVASQLLCLIRGRDKQRLIAIVEANKILDKRLLLINRTGKARRIVTIRQLAPFESAAVQGTLEQLMMDDLAPDVRIEAALVLAQWGKLPSPWQILQSIYTKRDEILPAHRQLFRALMPHHAESLLAMALFQDNRTARLLALDGLGVSGDAKIAARLAQLAHDDDPDIRHDVLITWRRIGQPIALKWATRLLDDECPAVRAIAIETVAELRANAADNPTQQVSANG